MTAAQDSFIVRWGLPLEIDCGQPDPYMTPCPAWCTGGYHVESSDEDRSHFGEIVNVLIRNVRATHFAAKGQTSSYTMGYLELFLQHRVLHRDPQIVASLHGAGPALKLTLDEAEQLAGVLALLVEAAR